MNHRTLTMTNLLNLTHTTWWARERDLYRPAQQTEFASVLMTATRGAGWTRRLFANREHWGLGAYRGLAAGRPPAVPL